MIKDFDSYTIRRVRKHTLNHDYSIGIPEHIIKAVGLDGGDSVKISAKDGKMIFEPIHVKRSLTYSAKHDRTTFNYIFEELDKQ